MAGTPRSSFIPKQTAGAVPSSVRRRRRFHIFGFLSSVVFVSSLLLGAGAYFYKDYAEAQLMKEKENLAAERGKFNEGDITVVREFDRKLRAANFLLDNHLSPSKIFDALELNTLKNVQFTSFSFSQRPSHDVTLTIKGSTEQFKTVALQALEFDDNALLKNVIFKQIGTKKITSEDTQDVQLGPLGKEREVNFTVTGSVTSMLLAFSGERQLPPEATEEPSTQVEASNGTNEQPAEDQTDSVGQ